MNVLIVDDNEANRKLLRITLRAEGHRTIDAADGIEALAMLETHQVDAIICDVLMPRMDGYRLCYEVRNIERLRDVLFIVYTSTFTTSQDENLARELGADRFLRKPAPLKEILAGLEPASHDEKRARAKPRGTVAELNALQGYSEVLVRKLEGRNLELQLTKEQLQRTNRELLERTGELERARGRLETTANQLQSLFDNLDDVFFSLDIAQRRLVQISPACEKVFGLSQRAFFENPMLWKEVTLPADRNVVEAGEADLDAGRLWHREYRIRKPGGEIRWVQAKIKPFLDGNGSLVRIDGVFSDIDSRKQLEQQLLHSQKLEAVGRLAGGGAHDFNNLLTAIFGYSDLVLGDMPEGSPQRWRMEEIKAAGERASGLTRQLLAFSRKQLLDPEILDLNSIVSSAERLLQRLIGENIHLTTRLAPGLRAIRADFGQIEQVIVNLAVNARDAMPDGGNLTIETADVHRDAAEAPDDADAPSGSWVMLSVRDTGTGMTDEVRSHVFEPFFTTKEAGKGSGLGLATVYGIVKQSGGHICVDTGYGLGTTFRIYLAPAERPAVAVLPAEPPKDHPSNGETILLVEDEDMLRKLIFTVLRNKGYNVIEAANGLQALEVRAGYPGIIDLLLTDTVMPGMSGPTLSERLRLAHPELKVLYMSGYTDNTVFLQDIQQDAAFLQKPFGPDVLARKVSEVLTSR
jgi:two-component system, cell cycle sensor histidine kinase and response regulator CckA